MILLKTPYDKNILATRDAVCSSPRASGTALKWVWQPGNLATWQPGNLATEQAKVPRKVTMSSADVWGKPPNNKLRGDDPPLIHDISGVFISRT